MGKSLDYELSVIDALNDGWQRKGFHETLRKVWRYKCERNEEDPDLFEELQIPSVVPDAWRLRRVWLGNWRCLSFDVLEVEKTNPINERKLDQYGGVFSCFDNYNELGLHFRLFRFDRMCTLIEVPGIVLLIGEMPSPPNVWRVAQC